MLKPRLKSPQDFASDEKFSAADLRAIERVSKRYAVAITPHVISTIKGPVESDPVAKQYVPQMQELRITPDEMPDPIGDYAHTPVKGLVHRYPDRVLFKLANICAVYCRFCFRREMVGPGSAPLTVEDKHNAYDYIRENKKIWEVILTGGDPLVLSARQLSETLDTLCAIPHVEVIRIHTRLPAADPARITDELCKALTRDKAIYVAIHINHPQEITPEVAESCRKLHAAGCVLLSQSVLLKGVNDQPEILEALFRKLAAIRVKPYYLHHPDKAPGTGHFRLTLKEGKAIVKKLLGRVSGICQPHYMLDIPGGHGKAPVTTNYLEETETGYVIEDFNGNKHAYTEDFMTEVRFYHMERQGLEQVLPSLLSKALENGHRILVKTANEKEAERLNDHLWTFSADVFLPHGSKKDGFAAQQPVWLTAENGNPNSADVLILTQGTTADDVSGFKLCCELLDGRDSVQVTEARSRWKSYKDSGHSLTYWQQGQKGWEKKDI